MTPNSTISLKEPQISTASKKETIFIKNLKISLDIASKFMYNVY